VISPNLDIIQDGNKFSIKIHNLYLTKESSFVVGEEFEEAHMINGALMKVSLLKAKLQAKAIIIDRQRL